MSGKMSKMTESELEETLKILYHTDRYLYDCLCIHLMALDKEIEQSKHVNKELSRCLEWHIEAVERYEKALQEIAESNEDSSCNKIALKYEVIADKALNG